MITRSRTGRWLRSANLTAALAILLAFAPWAAAGDDDAAAAKDGTRFPGRRGGDAVIGLPAPPLGLDRKDLWIGSEPLEPSKLEGRVVLVRWWTDTCPFCEASAPSIRRLHEEYAERGLFVLGVFHPKPPAVSTEDDAAVRERMRVAAERFEFTFPIALDSDWAALSRWWLDHVPGGWTSVTFLLDRSGTIRYVHPGGEYHEGGGGSHWDDHASCRRELAGLESEIRRLLEE